MSNIPDDASNEFDRLAMDKLESVLGRERAQQLIAKIMAERGVRLRTAQDLYTFSEELSKLGGFEGAVGAMLGVTAIIRGARG